MQKKERHILWFEEISNSDVSLVGGKNASLGEMYNKLVPIGIRVPGGFSVTASAYFYFLATSGLDKEIRVILRDVDTRDIKDLQRRSRKLKSTIVKAKFPPDLEKAIIQAYKELCGKYGKNIDVAVRSSATAEDLPTASFAGQQETFLNIRGDDALLVAVKKAFASLFTARAISYREDKGFDHFKVGLSIGVQKMVRSDLASSGVAFTIDTETGFEDVVVINGSFGLGETIVQGKVIPDEFIVFKPTLKKGFKAIIAHDLGRKTLKLVYSKHGTREVKISKHEQEKFCLSDKEILELAGWCVKIEEHFSRYAGQYRPMDIEWAKDGKTGKLFIVQARPETVHSTAQKNVYREYRLEEKTKPLLKGIAVGTKIATGRVRVIKDTKRIEDFKEGEILVTEITDPDWEPIMKIASAIITDKGGRTSHAAIVSRELGVPCVVGSKISTKVLKTGQEITVDCSSGKEGNIYKGKLPFEVIEHRLDKIPDTRTKVMVNIGSPDEAFRYHLLPVKGVGLGRLEFIIAGHIKIHPNALIDFSKLKRISLKDAAARKTVREIEALTIGYKNKKNYYIDELAEGIAKIGAAFWPHEVIIRFSDFKTNEYRTLIGGDRYEPAEENPMLGWRGASRYYDPEFKQAFGLECLALKKVRDEMGLKNVTPMIPFCRTAEEGRKVLKIMKENGLDRKRDKSLKVYVMCEIPSNVLSVNEFLEIFDGMSIGSNDLTQLTLGLDRDSSIISHISNENDPAVKKLIEEVILACRKKKKYIGICGQAPSDFPEFTEFLVQKGISSISLNPDTVVKTILKIYKAEKK